MKLTIECSGTDAAHIIECALKARIAEIRERAAAADGMPTDGYLRAISVLEGALFQVTNQCESALAEAVLDDFNYVGSRHHY